MTRILLLTLVFAPDGVSTSVLMSELALEFQAMGHEVTVLTTTPHYNVEPEARASQPLTNRWGRILRQSNYQGISVYHVSIPEKSDRVGARLLDYARFHLVGTLAGLSNIGDYDIILSPSPPLTIGLQAWLLGQMKRVPFIYNVQEIYPDIAVSLGVLTNQRAIRWFERLERFIYGRAHTISVISESFRQRLLQKNVPDSKIAIIPNFVDTDFMQPGARHNNFSKQHRLDHKFVVLYAGNIGLTQGLETILSAAKLLRDLPDVIIVVVGDGTRRHWLEEQLKTAALDNILLLPYQPRSVVPQIYASSDLCLVPLKRGTAQETFPSKIYTIMAAGRAVIAAADPHSELAKVVKDSQSGWAIPADDAQALASTIREALVDRETLQEMGKNGRQYVLASRSRQSVARKYDQLMQHILTNQ